MSIQLYEKIIKDLSSINFDGTILYSAFSEPLLYKNLEEAIKITRKYISKARIEIVTNGDLLTEVKLRNLFDSGLTAVCVSMYDGPHQFETFKKLQKKIGLKNKQFIYRVRWLSRHEHFGITLSNRAGAIELKNIGIEKLKRPKNRPCFYPFYQLLINYDGSVLLCAHDWQKRLVVGNANKKSIIDIWNKGAFEKVRKNLINNSRNFSPCNLCDVDGMLMGKRYFKKWTKYYEKNKKIPK